MLAKLTQTSDFDNYVGIDSLGGTKLPPVGHALELIFERPATYAGRHLPRIVSLLSSIVTRALPSAVGLTLVPRTISLAVRVLPYRRWFASLSGSTDEPPRDKPANSTAARPYVR